MEMTVIDRCLAVMQVEIAENTELLNTYKGKEYPKGYEGLMDRLDDRLNVLYNVNVLISALVLVKVEIDKELRNNPAFTLLTKAQSLKTELSEYIASYKSISYSLGSEVNAIRDFLSLHYPEHKIK